MKRSKSLNRDRKVFKQKSGVLKLSFHIDIAYAKMSARVTVTDIATAVTTTITTATAAAKATVTAVVKAIATMIATVTASATAIATQRYSDTTILTLSRER
jgi:hypothetical protein